MVHFGLFTADSNGVRSQGQLSFRAQSGIVTLPFSRTLSYGYILLQGLLGNAVFIIVTVCLVSYLNTIKRGGEAHILEDK
jgi:hypothetical protein